MTLCMRYQENLAIAVIKQFRKVADVTNRCNVAFQLKSPPHTGATNSSGFPSVNTFQSTGSFASSSFASSGFAATTTTQSPSTKLPPPFNSFAASFSQTQQQSTGNQSAQHPTPTQQQPQGILTTPNLSQPPPPVKPSMQKGSSSQQQFTTKVNQSFSAQSQIQPSGTFKFLK